MFPFLILSCIPRSNANGVVCSHLVILHRMVGVDSGTFPLSSGTCSYRSEMLRSILDYPHGLMIGITFQKRHMMTHQMSRP